MEYESDSDTDCNWCTWNGLQKPGKETEGLETKGRIEIVQTRGQLK